MRRHCDIIDNEVNSAGRTTLVGAVNAAGLEGMFKGPGPFTVCAPTNADFRNAVAGVLARGPCLLLRLSEDVVKRRIDCLQQCPP